MARLTDHDIRDGEHALRMEFALIWGRYSRRMLGMGKAYLQEDLETALKDGRPVDGTALGRAAAARAASDYFGSLAGVAPQSAIEGEPTQGH